jgi:hypothetical protein
MPNIPLQHRVTMQILQHWQPFRDLKLTFAVSRRAEQLSLRTQQRIIATAEDSVLRTEMANIESKEEDAPSVSSTSSRCVGWGKSGHTAEMRRGMLVSCSPFLPLVSVQIYRPWRSYHSRLLVAKSSP